MKGANRICWFLPNFESLNLYRSDDLDKLTIWAPKLLELNLQACYGINRVNILDQVPASFNSPEYDFSGEPGRYEINVINTTPPAGNALSHRRCQKVLREIDDHPFYGMC